MNNHERELLAMLGQEMRDDITRAECLGRGTVSLMVLKYHARRIEELMERQQEATVGGDGHV